MHKSKHSFVVIYDLVASYKHTSFSCYTKPENLDIFYLIAAAYEIHSKRLVK